MMPENSKDFRATNELLKSGENGNDDRLQDVSNSDAAAENARESERLREASRAAEPSYQSDIDKLPENRGNADDNETTTTQGTDEEVEENMSGTTNLTIEQLKKARDSGGYSPEGTDIKHGL